MLVKMFKHLDVQLRAQSLQPLYCSQNGLLPRQQDRARPGPGRYLYSKAYWLNCFPPHGWGAVNISPRVFRVLGSTIGVMGNNANYSTRFCLETRQNVQRNV